MPYIQSENTNPTLTIEKQWPALSNVTGQGQSSWYVDLEFALRRSHGGVKYLDNLIDEWGYFFFFNSSAQTNPNWNHLPSFEYYM